MRRTATRQASIRAVTGMLRTIEALQSVLVQYVMRNELEAFDSYHNRENVDLWKHDWSKEDQDGYSLWVHANSILGRRLPKRPRRPPTRR